MFTAPQITSTAIVPAPKRVGAALKGSLAYTPLYELNSTNKRTPDITVDGNVVPDRKKRFIGITLSETLDETDKLACTVQLSGSTVVRLKEPTMEVCAAGINSFDAGLPEVKERPLKFGDILYGTKDGMVTGAYAQYAPPQGESVVLLTDANAGNPAQCGKFTIANTANDTTDPTTRSVSYGVSGIPIGRFISRMGKIGGFEYVNMLICRNPLRRLDAMDQKVGKTTTTNALVYEHPFSRSDDGGHYNAPVYTLGQVREGCSTTTCPTKHLAYLADAAYRRCNGQSNIGCKASALFSNMPFAPSEACGALTSALPTVEHGKVVNIPW